MGHFSSRYEDSAIHLDEARAVHANTFAAEDGLYIQLGKWQAIFGNADKTQEPPMQK